MSDIGRFKGEAKKTLHKSRLSLELSTFSSYFQASVFKHISFRQQAACYRTVPWTQVILF